MHRIQILGALAAVLFAAIISGTPAQAQATRTWVSGTGNDADPCSYTAPCKTFAGAISKTAAGGEIDAQTPGGYGQLTITKSLTIDGGGGQVASVLASSGTGIIVNSAGAFVVLRNLSINGAGGGSTGISVNNAARVSVEHCNIQGFGSYGISFQPSAANSLLYVSNTMLHDMAAYGAVLIPTGTGAMAVFDNVQDFHNGVGLYVGSNATMQARNTSFSQNTSLGLTINATTAGAVLYMDGSSISNNGGTGLLLGGASHSVAVLSDTQITNNTGDSMIIPAAGDVVSFGNNRIYGNAVDTLPDLTAGLR